MQDDERDCAAYPRTLIIFSDLASLGPWTSVYRQVPEFGGCIAIFWPVFFAGLVSSPFMERVVSTTDMPVDTDVHGGALLL